MNRFLGDGRRDSDGWVRGSRNLLLLFGGRGIDVLEGIQVHSWMIGGFSNVAF